MDQPTTDDEDDADVPDSDPRQTSEEPLNGYTMPTDEDLQERLQKMDPHDFEKLVADICERLGWDTRVVGGAHDHGIDVIATSGNLKTLIQAKRYGSNTTVGTPEVQQYGSLYIQEENVDIVTIVTTGEFSQQAEELALDLDIILVDGNNLLGMLGGELLANYFDDIHYEGASIRERPESGPLAGLDFPADKDREDCKAAVYAARDHLRERGPGTEEGEANMQASGGFDYSVPGSKPNIIVRVANPERLRRLGYSHYEILDAVESTEGYQGEWWTRIVKPGLESLPDVEKMRRDEKWWYVGDQ